MPTGRDWPMVGRQQELGVIADALRRPDSAGVVVTGQPGVGKTRLAAAALANAANAGFATEWIIATRTAATIPLGAFATVLPSMPEATDRYQLLAGAIGALRKRAGDRRLVLGVDDANLLDDSSATLVQQLAATGKAAVLLTSRSGEPMTDALTALWKEASADLIELPTLSQEDVIAVLAQALGAEVDVATGELLWQSTRGNALFLRELVRDGLESGSLVRQGLTWGWEGPLVTGTRLIEIIQLRLGRLGTAERELVDLLAVGEPVGAALLDGLVAGAHLCRIEEKGLLSLGRDGRRTVVRLAHPLYGEVVRLQMPALRARTIRRRLADAIEATGARRRTDLLRIATWRLDADGTASRELLGRAADLAERAADHVLAERLARAAVDAGGQFDAAYTLGRALYWQSRMAEADRALASAETQAETDWDRAQVAITRSSALFWGGLGPDRAEEVLRRAEAAVTDPGQRAELLAHGASFRLFRGQPRDALATVLPLLQTPDLHATAQIRALVVAVPGLAVTGQLARAGAEFHRGIELVVRPGSGLVLAVGQLVVGQFLALLWGGSARRRRSSYQRGLRSRSRARRGRGGIRPWSHLTATLVTIGDELGLYRAMAGAGPLTSAELAKRTATTGRYVREWLAAQAAAGYVTYEGDNRYSLPEEQAEALTNEESPAFVAGGFQAMTAAAQVRPKMVEAFRTGNGVGWHEHDPNLFAGTERFFRPGYAANLVSSWIPALQGAETKLQSGARVADIGCGHGASTIIMATAYPNSTFVGYDYHGPSIEAARKRAAEAGLADRVSFEVAAAGDFPGRDFDLIAYFDCLHDMGDPVGALAHARQALAADGAVMLVEPFANDDVADNLTPIGRVFYSASTLICTPASLSQDVGLGLGAQAGEKRLAEVAKQAGLSQFRRATETPFNLVFEARP